MNDSLTRRELLALTAGAVVTTGSSGTGERTARAATASRAAPGEAEPFLISLSSRSGVYTPARGSSVMQFGFDFPEPSIAIGGLALGFRIQTFENVYALDADLIHLHRGVGTITLTCGGLLTCGGQVKASGRLVADIVHGADRVLQWRARAESDFPIKSITSVIRGLPRGTLSISGGEFLDPGEDEQIFEYPQLFGGMSTPLALLKAADGRLFELAARQEAVRPARFFFQPGPDGYRVELIHEHEGWSSSRNVQTCLWRVGPASSYASAAAAHFAHVESTYRLPKWQTRSDAPDWMRDTRLVVALHGAHWTGYIFNDYAGMLDILKWVATQIDPRAVLVFLPAWDGRYYWNYPRYVPEARMGGVEGFAGLVSGAQRLGFRIAPMFGANSANRGWPEFKSFADATTQHVDGDAFDLSWVDWDNDRRNEGWMPFMNLAVPSWRRWLAERISAVIDQFGVDAYFLDIAGAWENNRQGDMYVATGKLIADLRERHPGVPPIGEMLYDAQMAYVPMSQVTRYAQYPAGHDSYVRSFQHLSRPAPGRGSTGVHEAGFGKYVAEIAATQRAIPTLTVVDDTFTNNREAMADYIARAKRWSPPQGS